jgi:hypothetical protein
VRRTRLVGPLVRTRTVPSTLLEYPISHHMVVSQHTSPKTLSPTSDGCWPSQAPIAPAPPLATGTAHLPIARTNPATTKPHHAREHPPAPRARTPANRQSLRGEPTVSRRLHPASRPATKQRHTPPRSPQAKTASTPSQAQSLHRAPAQPHHLNVATPGSTSHAYARQLRATSLVARDHLPVDNATPEKDIASTPSQAPLHRSAPAQPHHLNVATPGNAGLTYPCSGLCATAGSEVRGSASSRRRSSRYQRT